MTKRAHDAPRLASALSACLALGCPSPASDDGDERPERSPLTEPSVAPERAGDPPQPDTPTAEDHAGNELLAAKLAPYIECFNHFHLDMRMNAHKYRRWAGDGEELGEISRLPVPWMDLIDDPGETCRLEDAQTLDDAPLEQAGRAFVDALSAAKPVIEDADLYYKRSKRYIDDEFEGARQLHPRLLAAFEDYETAHARLLVLIRERREDLRLRDLDERERVAGRDLVWHTMKMMVLANNLLLIMDVRNPMDDEVDLTRAERIAEELDAVFESAKALGERAPSAICADAPKVILAAENLRFAVEGMMGRARAELKGESKRGDRRGPRRAADAFVELAKTVQRTCPAAPRRNELFRGGYLPRKRGGAS